MSFRHPFARADMSANVLILRTAGTNCDQETEFAFRLAGAQTCKLHVNALRREPQRLQDFHILALPGGFSYGDDLGAGKVLANELLATPAARHRAVPRRRQAHHRHLQRLPGAGQDRPAARHRALEAAGHADVQRFGQVRGPLGPPAGARVRAARSCGPGERIYLPVAHAEGKFIVEDEAVLEQHAGATARSSTATWPRTAAGRPTPGTRTAPSTTSPASATPAAASSA